MVRADMAKWMTTHDANVIMDMKPWAYRLYVDGEGSDTEVWTAHPARQHRDSRQPQPDRHADGTVPHGRSGSNRVGACRLASGELAAGPAGVAPIGRHGLAFRRHPRRADADTVDATLELSADGTAAGRTGCNDFNGRYAVDGNHLAFTGLGYTKMACAAEPMATESRADGTQPHQRCHEHGRRASPRRRGRHPSGALGPP